MSEMTTKSTSILGAGTVVERPFIRVVFQSGFPNQVGVNGVRVQEVIQLAMERLEEYQEGSLPCVENEQAIRSLRAAMEWLDAREKRRREQGVLNTMEAHSTVRTEDAIQDFSATGS